MTRNLKAIVGSLLLATSALPSWAVVRTISEQTSNGLATAVLTDPYPDAKPLVTNPGLLYLYVEPNWWDSTAVMTQGFKASLGFTLASPQPNTAEYAYFFGYMVDRGRTPVDIVTPGRVQASFKVWDGNHNLVDSGTYDQLLNDPTGTGWGYAKTLSPQVSTDFLLEVSFAIQAGTYLPKDCLTCTTPLQDRYVFQGFGIDRQPPIPEPGALCLAGAGACLVAARARHKRA